jgi:hypothetical protein
MNLIERALKLIRTVGISALCKDPIVFLVADTATTIIAHTRLPFDIDARTSGAGQSKRVTVTTVRFTLAAESETPLDSFE